MNYLITGANGFIGKAIVKKILEDEKNFVYGIVSSLDDVKDIAASNVKFFELLFDDYRRISEVINDKIDITFHFAWAGLCGASAKDFNLQISDVIATHTLLEECKKLQTKTFIFASSMNVLELQSYLTNPTAFSPRNIFIHAAAKMNAELIARVFCFENNIKYNEGYIAMAYGEGNKSKMIPNVFIQSVLNGIKPKLSKGLNKYDVIYISDIVDAFLAISEKGIDKKSYYIGHNWEKTFKEIFMEMGTILNPAVELDFGAYPQDNNIDFGAVDRRELTQDTGWVPSADFRDSVLRTADWIRNCGIDFLN